MLNTVTPKWLSSYIAVVIQFPSNRTVLNVFSGAVLGSIQHKLQMKDLKEIEEDEVPSAVSLITARIALRSLELWEW